MLDAYGSFPQYWRHMRPIVAELNRRGVPLRAWSRAGEFDAPVMRGTDRNAAELVLVAGHQDAYERFPDKRVIYVEHGAGQSYVGVRGNGYSGAPDLGHVVLFLCPSEHVAERWRKRYPRAEAVVVGSPALDWSAEAAEEGDELHDGDHAELDADGTGLEVSHAAVVPAAARRHAPGGARASYALTDAPTTPERRCDIARPIVALTWHWRCTVCPETMPALPHYEAALPAILEALRARELDVVGTSHPRSPGEARALWGRLGVEYEPDPDVVLRRASVLVADNTSLAYEAAAIGVPVVSLNAPWYRREVEHGLRFWSHVPGVQCDEPADFIDAIVTSLDGAGSEERERAAAYVYAWRDGKAAARAADAIERLL